MTMWHHNAACIGMSDLFLAQGKLSKKKAVCESCTVKQECLTEAMRLQDYEPSTVYGGFNGKEREALSEGTVW